MTHTATQVARVLVLVFSLVVSVGLTSKANAATRAVLIPGRTAILLMEGVSSAGVDLAPRLLYDAIQQAPVKQGGGDGKVVKSAVKDFTIACVTRNSSYESVVCNIAIKPSAFSTIESSRAIYRVDGGESAALYASIAGAAATAPFFFESPDKQIRIEATPQVFSFTFAK